MKQHALLFPILLALSLVITTVSCRINTGNNKEPVLPVLVRQGTNVQTDSVFPSNVTATTALASARITSAGVKIVEYGFSYSTNSTPSSSDKKIVVGNTAPTTIPFFFNNNLTGLQNTTTYYMRAYVKDSSGTVYGDIKSFKTASNAVAVVQTTAPGAITYFTAQTGGTITSKGSTNITEYGVVYSSVNSSPTVADTKKVVGTTSPTTLPSSFTTTISSLAPSTLYYVRAYAINAGGIAYGTTLRFTTIDARPKVNTTRAPYGADSKSVSANGSIESPEGSAITRYGFVYASSVSTPTLADYVADVGTTVTSTFPFPYSSTLSFARLTAGTYYIRAFAANAYGVTYGTAIVANVYFDPTVTTGDYTLASYIATLSGSITTGGSAAIQEYGFVYLPTANATFGFNYGDTGVLTLKGSAPATTFPLTYALGTPSGTTTNTYYSYKAYVKTVNGIVYGDVKTFYINSKD